VRAKQNIWQIAKNTKIKQELSKFWDKRSGRITVNSEDTIMPIHAQKASRYWGQQFLKSRGFNTSCNEISLRKQVINLWRSAPPEKSCWKKRPVYAVGGYTRSLKTKRICKSILIFLTLWYYNVHKQVPCSRRCAKIEACQLKSPLYL